MARRKSLSSTPAPNAPVATSTRRINVSTAAATKSTSGASSTNIPTNDKGANASNQPRRKKRVCRVTVDITACRYAVIRKCLRERGFRLVKAKDGDAKPKWDIWWSDRGDLLRELPRLSAFQKINHFPAMEEICRKDFLANNLNAICKVLPDDFDYFPRSFLLPAESVELQKCMESAPKSATFIAKPRTLCQGKGISLVQSFTKLPKEPCVVQRYIDNPLLIDGFKFDLRIYVLVFSVHPLKLFIFKNGLARFCTSAFQRPTKRNLSQKRMHLTNYAVNKSSKHFQQATSSDENKGSKRTLAAIMKYLDDTGRYSSELVWTQICDIVVKTLLCIQPKLSSSYKSFFGENDATWGPKCFEVLGFDIMLDASGKAWLFEVNHAPSFAGDSPLDREIKSALISSTLTLLDVTNEKKRAFLKGNRLEWSKRLWTTQPSLNIAKKAGAANAVAKCNEGEDSIQNQREDAKANNGQKSAVEVLAQADRPEQSEGDDKDGDGDSGRQGDNSEDDNSASSDSENGNDTHEDTDEESDSGGGGGGGDEKQSRQQQTKSRSAGGAEPPVKLPSIRNIFQKKRNRISPCSLEVDCSSAAGPNSVVQLATRADPVLPATEFTNEFVQIYPIVTDDTSRVGQGKSPEPSQLRLLYEHIHAAAEVNKSKLWS
ncbi:hypothetical protein Gpo141_00003216 [Globisporangium polare]